jgi:hypothetical protein
MLNKGETVKCEISSAALGPVENQDFTCGLVVIQALDATIRTDRRPMGEDGTASQADRVLGAAEELAKLQMLLDPAEQQFDLLAGFVKRGDLDRRAFQIIGNEGQFCAVIAPEADAAHRNRKPGIACADEINLGIIDDREAIPVSFRTALRSPGTTINTCTAKATKSHGGPTSSLRRSKWRRSCGKLLSSEYNDRLSTVS